MERYGVEVKCGAPPVERDPQKARLHPYSDCHRRLTAPDIPGNVKGVIGWMK